MGAQIVSFKCILKNIAGQTISSSYNRDVLTATTDQQANLKGLAAGLMNLQVGEQRSIKVRAEEAYGFYDPKKVILFPLKKIPDSAHVRVGQEVSIMSKTNQLRTYRVVHIHGDMVSLDGNHPLAGQDLIFEIEATDARDATAEEVSESVNDVSIQRLHS